MIQSKLFDLEVLERERLAREEPEKLEALFREDIRHIIETLAKESQSRAEAFQAELDELRKRFKPGSLELIGALIQRSVLVLTQSYDNHLVSNPNTLKPKDCSLLIH